MDELRRAIVANPADDLPRLVYADWLDEHGDPARAEFIRVQCELARTDEADPHYRHLEDREHDLLSEHEPRWLDAGSDRWHEWQFRRGFVEQVTAAADAAPAEATANTIPRELRLVSEERSGEDNAVIPLFDLAESLDLSAWHEYGATADVFLTRREWPRLTALDLSHRPGLTRLPELLSRCPFGERLRGLSFGGRSGPNFAWADGENETFSGRGLITQRHAMPVERFTAFDCGLDASDLAWLLSKYAASIDELNVSDNPLAPDGWRSFRDLGPNRLSRLDVSGTPLAGISLGPLLASGWLDTLTDLEMNRCGSARANMEAVAGSAFWPQAKSFRAHGGTIPAFTIEPLCASGPVSLRLLDLADNYLRAEGVRLLASAPWAGGVTWLALSRNYLDDDAVRVLADGAFRSLRTLHLAHNNLDQDRSDGEQITTSGLHAVTDSPSLANLRILTVSFTGVGDAGVDLALNAPHWRLSGLGVAGCDLSPDAIRILANSPRLQRLEWLDLSTNPRLSGDALLPLAESPYLSRLCELDVSGIYVGERTRQALRDRLGRRLSG